MTPIESQRRPSRIARTLVASSLLFGPPACGRSAPHSTSSHQTVQAFVDERLPTEQATDWVSYADHLVVATVESERVLPPTAIEKEIGEGAVGRRVTAGVESVVWSRPQAPDIPKSISFNDIGLSYKDGGTTPMATENGPAYRPGRRYLMLVTRFNDGWAAIGPTMHLVDNRVTIEGRTDQTAMVRIVQNATPSQVTSVLNSTTPYPAAAENRDLDPEARFQAVEHAASNPSATGGH